MANEYGLTREMADAIVKAVRDDPRCRALLPSVSLFKFFAPIGHAGTARNFFNAWPMGVAAVEKIVMDRAGFPEAGERTRDHWERLGAKQACDGVAATTERVLSRVAGTPGYEFLVSAASQDRAPGDAANDFHSATRVTVTNDKSYVFDWHATLDIGNPLIFPSVAAFKAGAHAVRYAQFWGWT